MRETGARHDDATLLSGDLKLAGRLDERFFALLEAIDNTGSINRAASVAGYSYKGAWLVLESAANLANEPLFTTETGGRGGGGTRLTSAAHDLLSAWRELQAHTRRFLREQEAWLVQLPALSGLLRRIAVKTTARNQFAGTITAVEDGPVTTQVSIKIPCDQEITATMTTAAAKRLKLAVGQDAIALVKSSHVVLVIDFAGYALSARNQFSGTISRIERGATTSLVVVTLAGGVNLTSSVTNDAVDALSLAVGQAATAVFKAYSVMLAVAQS
ncbi:TOBE domain-containing protein [Trinickia caryophylli]|uniref:Molybdate transport system regulatory protein n=1 Tax=Trinickia caryophylli TaxID=28094 RepID=A0A1X7EE75_TRICW|nr:TOBE domain-containing protein [Trinickia caryophylli]PMS11142.1 molybdenum transport protein ModE [Trinickia caryophylli]TRX14601.1 LysR family transcriptional regulator [Trinickia caryophylli]WQE14443.1 TOBE domain-containing protein [Trinickia caryophylli]SMF32411.1 molybdate transport system regulatory protein [Trinickia caryophylli]GLU32154.1 ModE family transcriptional regulator [Trinickia caryophylli]